MFSSLSCAFTRRTNCHPSSKTFNISWRSGHAKLLTTHTIFPATLHHIQPDETSRLFDFFSLPAGPVSHLEDAVAVSYGMVRPMISKCPPCANILIRSHNAPCLLMLGRLQRSCFRTRYRHVSRDDASALPSVSHQP